MSKRLNFPSLHLTKTGMSPMQSAVVMTPVADLNFSPHGLVLTRWLRTFVKDPEQPESTVASKAAPREGGAAAPFASEADSTES